MAKNKRTVSDNIHSNVVSRINENKDSLTKEATRLSSQNHDAYRKIIHSSTLMQKAINNPDKNIAINPELALVFSQAIETVAHEKGIKPGGDGKFTQEQLTTDLSPEAMIKYAASHLRKGASSKEELDNINNEIISDITNAYKEGEEENSQITVPESLLGAAKMTDEEIMEITDEELKLAILAEIEQTDPQRSFTIKQKIDNNQKDLADKAGRFEGFMNDPDWGHDKGDDDFKIEQGDIIEYLMKDIILSTAAWAGNRVAGFAGTIAYETCAGIYHSIQPRWREKWHEWMKDWDELNKGTYSEEEKKARKKRLETCLNIYEQNKAVYEENIEKNLTTDNEKEQRLLKLNRQAIKHFFVIDGDKLRFPNDENGNTVCEDINNFDLTFKTKQEADYFTANSSLPENSFKERSNPDGTTSYVLPGKEYIKLLQEHFDTIVFNKVKEKCPNKTDAEIKEFISKYNSAIEDIVKGTGSKSSVENLKNSNPELAKALNEAQDETCTQITLNKELRLYQAQSNLFIETYTAFMLAEEVRKNPETKILDSDDKIKEFLAQAKLDAQIILQRTNERRKNPETRDSTPSITTMTEEMEKLLERSKNAFGKKSKEDIKNPYESYIPESKEEKESLLEAARKDITVQDLIDDLTNDLNRRDAELNDLTSRGAATDKKREMLQKRKKALQETSQRARTLESSGVALNEVKVNKSRMD